MSKYFSMGNGSLLVLLDKNAQIRDFYFPHIGQENHVNNNIHKFGVWADSQFYWIDSDAWEKKLAYKKESLVTEIKAVNKNLELELAINDSVHPQKDIYLRKIVVTNKSNQKKEVKVFCHQVFQITGDTFGNTVYYNPELKAIVFYKGKRYFLVNGMLCNEKRHGISDYATGTFHELGLEGTYVDAQDGTLSNNPIAHGSVDAIVSFNFSLDPGQVDTIYYWICAGKKNGSVTRLNEHILKYGPESLIDQTDAHWVEWVNKTKFEFFGLNSKIVDLFKRSLLLVNTHIDKHGAFIASGDSGILHFNRDTYAYMWPRDGALIARSLDRAGCYDLTEKFFKFCSKVLTEEGYLFHKYNPDGSLGSSWHPWIHEGHFQLPIQEDQIALVLDALWKHYAQHKKLGKYVQEVFECFIRKAANFMYEYMDKKTGLPKESYDLWEEKLGIHTFTCATVYAGFRAAANFEKVFGTEQYAEKFLDVAENIKKNMLKHLYDEKKGGFIKGLFYHEGELKRDETIDASSAYGVFEFKVLDVDDPRLKVSFEVFKEKLLCKPPVGGYARYENDNYHKIVSKSPGNPWFITVLWLAEYYVALAKNQEELKPALDIFEWVEKQALPTGVLSEQLNPNSGEPLSVAPLTWSHAAFVIAVNKYLEKLDVLGICKMCNPPMIKENNVVKNGKKGS